MNMRFGTWNVLVVCRSGSLRTETRELLKCKLDLLGVQEVRWEEGVMEPTDSYAFFYGNGNHHIGIGSSMHSGIKPAVQGKVS
jgi:hypothetical protein